MAVPDPSDVRLPGPWHHFDVRANGLRFHAVEYVERAAADSPLVLMLHGFGEFWWSWRHQLRELTEAGYRAVAVDLRGYGDSDKPPRGYDGWTLAGDTHGLIRSLGHTEATLVGHADGGLVCWGTATLHPRVVSRIAVLASPHPRALRRAVLRDKTQREAFLGGFLYKQLPRFGERQLTRNDGAYLVDYFGDRAGARWRESADFDEALTLNRRAVQVPGAAHCSLEYQRWAYRSQFRPDGAHFMELMDTPVGVPVLAVRGRDDTYITEATLTASDRWAPEFDYWHVPGSGHFVHEEQPERTNRLLLDWLG